MKLLKTILFLSFVGLSLSGYSQIVLKGYTCKFYEDQFPYDMAEMCGKRDTFRYMSYAKDVAFSVAVNDSLDEFKLGLELCFDDLPYIKTKDSLYISTDKNVANVYYYMIYIPDHQVSLSVRSARNDSLFADRSTWLLAQVRQNRKNKLYFVNERNQNCQNPDQPNR